jgi:hypothetical protein
MLVYGLAAARFQALHQVGKIALLESDQPVQMIRHDHPGL